MSMIKFFRILSISFDISVLLYVNLRSYSFDGPSPQNTLARTFCFFVSGVPIGAISDNAASSLGFSH